MCPLNSTTKNYGSGYKSLVDNLQQFREIGELPIQASLSSLDEGNGIEVTLKRHEGSRTQKRKLEDSSVEGSEAPSPVKTRTCLGISPKRSSKN